jgi:hypothetical protein
MTQRTSTADVVLNLTYACTDGGLILLDPMQQFFAGSATGASGQAIISTQGQSGTPFRPTSAPGSPGSNTWRGRFRGRMSRCT